MQAGGQAIVGAVTQGGGGGHQQSEDRAHAQATLTHAPEPALRCPDPPGQLVPGAGSEGQETMPEHGGARGSGAQVGNRNALKHGHYTREVLEFKRSVRELLRESAAKLELA